MGWRVVLGEVVSKIGGAWGPIDAKLALFDAVADPIKSHVYGFGAYLFAGTIDNSAGGGVVGGNGCSRLWVSHFLECGTEDSSLFGVEKKGADFGLSGGGHYPFDDLGDIDNGAIEHWGFAGELAKVEVSTGSTAGFRFGEVGGITVNVQDHVAGSEAEGGVGVGGTIV